MKTKAYIFCLAVFSWTTQSWSDQPLPTGYAVASANPLATNAGLEILAQGGNAFDAAVAVSAMLAVVEPYHSGIGGGGFWLLHHEKSNKNIFIDGREKAPHAANKLMFLDKQGKPKPAFSLNGGLAAAIPGEPAALVFMAKTYGRLPLSQTLAPAIRVAEQGFVVDYHFNKYVIMEDRLQQLQKYPAAAAIFLKNGKPYPIGERIVQKDLANTLRHIAQHGHEGFYKGDVAKRLVEAVNQAGGIWTLDDLASYHVKIREPLEGWYHHVHIVTAPLPSAGGISLLIMLNILADYPLKSFSDKKRIHYLSEAMRLAFWQRYLYMADPDFVTVPVQRLLSNSNTKTLCKYIKPDHATASGTLQKVSMQKKEGNNTTHFSILDQEGNRVAATLSINYIFGSSVVAAGTGVLLNDEMDDFSIEPTAQNAFGLRGGEKNYIEPGKRPLSSMSPTFLETPNRVAIVGTPGGSYIPSMMLLSTLAFSDSYGAITMVSGMRFHHQYMPDWLQFEPDTFSHELQLALKKMGYQLHPLRDYFGDMQAITWDRKHQRITAASDPRGIGRATVGGAQYHDYGLKKSESP